MSIFFYHFTLAFLPLTLICACFLARIFSHKITLFTLLGAVCGAVIYSALNRSANADEAKIYFEILYIFSVLLALFAYKFRMEKLCRISIFSLALACAYEYFLLSANFKIFAGELLDSGSLTNLFMVIFSAFLLVLLCALCIKILRNLKFCANLAFFAVCALLIISRLAFAALSVRQLGLFESVSFIKSSQFLSLIAKIIFANNQYLILVLLAIALFLGICALLKTPAKISRTDIIAYRINRHARTSAFSTFGALGVVCIAVCAICLYYLLIASKPPQIDTPTLVEPTNGEFVFDAEIVRDGKLHRFAYVTDDGHKVRFFIINRFSGRLSPVAVFDACSICGDMGYVKKGDELICIACNVRIFLPSVGKMGGCNPIPLEFTFEDGKIKIPLREIENGASFFSEIVEKQVIDPVSRNKISNNSKFSYLYFGRTYFFENEQNEQAFIANPQNFVHENGVLKELK